MVDFGKRPVEGDSIVTDLRRGSGDLRANNPSYFPFDAFEFDNSHVESTPDITVRSPWRFQFNLSTFTDDVLLDDGDGDSPKLSFVGGSNDDTISLWLDDEATAGDSFLRMRLADAAGDSHFRIDDSGGTQRFKVDSDGNVAVAGTLDIDGQTKIAKSSGNVAVFHDDLENWNASWRALEFPGSAVMVGATGGNAFFLDNAYYDGAWKYKHDGLAQALNLNSSGYLGYRQAATGLVNGSISWTIPFQINAGALANALTIDSAGLEVVGVVDIDKVGTTSLRTRIGTSGGDSLVQLYDDANVEQVRLFADGNSFFKGGNVGIGTSNPIRDFEIKMSKSGGQVRQQTYNESNTANSHAVVSICAGGTSGGNPFIHWHVPAGSPDNWSMGVDNSDNDKLMISANYGLGTKDYVVINGDGEVGVGSTDPQSMVHVVRGNAGVVARFEAAEADTGARIYVNHSSAYAAFYTYDQGTSVYQKTYLGHATDETKALIVDPVNGRMGILDSTPSYPLDVVGHMRSTKARVAAVTYTNDAGSITGNTVYDALSAYIDDGETVIASGGIDNGAGAFIYISHMSRSGTSITIAGLRSDGANSNIIATDSSGSAICDAISIAV